MKTCFEYFFNNTFFFYIQCHFILASKPYPVKNKSGMMHVKMAYGSYVTKVNM